MAEFLRLLSSVVLQDVNGIPYMFPLDQTDSISMAPKAFTNVQRSAKSSNLPEEIQRGVREALNRFGPTIKIKMFNKAYAVSSSSP